MNSAIKIGWSEINITSDKKASLMGQLAEQKTLYFKHRVIEGCQD